MANGHGGQRTPAHPAAVSGPGALSQRTDGNPATTQPPMVANGGPYGSRQEMEGIQSGAPLQGGGGGNTAPAGPSPADMIPFGAPTANPSEPVTAGAALGPGMGPEAAGITSDSAATMAQMKPLVRSLEMMANLPSATPETRAWVRALKARLAAS
jgi:hypothetical protein